MEETILLIIDPDSTSRNYLANTLSAKGYQVIAVPSGKEGYISAIKDQPALIIFDPDLPDWNSLELVSKLRQDRRTSDLPCIALSAQSRQEQAGALLAAGCNEFLVKSGQSMNALLGLIPRLLGADGEAAPPVRPDGGRLVVFLSAKGGTGTSSLCANIAECMARQNPAQSLAVVDLVLPLGSIAPIVGYREELNLSSLTTAAPETVSTLFLQENLPRPANWHFTLLPGVADPASANALQAGRVPELVKLMRQMYDMVFIDIGRSLSRISLPLILEADVIVLVVSADSSTVTLTRTVSDYLQQQGVRAERFYVLMNRAVGLEGVSKTQAEETIGLKIAATMPYAGGNVSLANSQNLSITAKYPKETLSLVLEQVTVQLRELIQKARLL